MAIPYFVVPTGAIDGVNTVFTVPVPYATGTTAVFINGHLVDKSSDDGWIETDPTIGEVTLKEAPLSSGDCPDVVKIFFLDTTPDDVITPFSGTLAATDSITGTITDITSLTGTITNTTSLTGTVTDITSLTGTIEETDAISAQITCVVD